MPIWTSANASQNNDIVALHMQDMGITSVSSYLRMLAIQVILCAFIGLCVGAYRNGVQGALVGTLLGLATPAALIWLAITVVHIAIYLITFCAVWVVIFYLARWLEVRTCRSISCCMSGALAPATWAGRRNGIECPYWV